MTGRVRALVGALLASLLAGVAVAEEGETSPADAAPAAEEELAEEERAGEEPDETAPEGAGPSATGPPPGVEVLRVRGRGIAAIETEVPASVTSFDAATIEALGAQDVSDLSRVTPNVTIVQPGSTQATFFVRGIGLSDFSSNAAGAVTIFQDGVALNAPAIQTGQLFDIEGVELLRGPQGSGPYRNASAGAITVRSRRPTGNYAAHLRSTLGRYAADGGKGAHPGMIQDYEGSLEFPIHEEALWSRFAFRLRDAEPFMTNGCGGATELAADQSEAICGETLGASFPTPNGPAQAPVIPGSPKRVGDRNTWSARGILRWSPPDGELEVFGNLHGSRLDQQSTLGQILGTGRVQGIGRILGGRTGSTDSGTGYWEPDQFAEVQEFCNQDPPGSGLCRRADGTPIRPRDPEFPELQAAIERSFTKRPLDRKPFRGDYRYVGRETRDAWGGFLSAEWELAGIDFSALSSYDTYERSRDQDTDFTPDPLFEQLETDEAWQVYNELHFGGELDTEPFAWELGGYYLREELSVRSITSVQVQAGVGDFDRKYSQTIDSIGLWGSFAWDFLDDFTLEGGVRYNWERKKYPYALLETPSALIEPFSNVANESWQTPTGQIILTWHIDERSQAYLRYTRGFKAGHLNAQFLLPEEEIRADPEFNDAWEGGLRGGWFDGRLAGALAVFYYKYEGYQVFLFRDQPARPPVLEILNADEAENYGLELEGRIEPLRGLVPRFFDGLRISGNFAFLHGEYIDFQISTTTLDGGQSSPTIVDFSGKQFASSPEFTVSTAVEWPLDLGRWGVLTPRYDLSWSDVMFFDPNEGRGSQKFDLPTLPEDTIAQRAFFLHNVRLSYRVPSGNAEISFWARNLTDEVYKTFAFDASNFQRLVLNFVGDPRTVGFDLTFLF